MDLDVKQLLNRLHTAKILITSADIEEVLFRNTDMWRCVVALCVVVCVVCARDCVWCVFIVRALTRDLAIHTRGFADDYLITPSNTGAIYFTLVY